MELLLLGPVELRAAGRPVPLGGPHQRGVLAALAVDAGVTVPVETLIDRVWGEAPPPQARHNLQVRIARLRRLIGGQVEGAAPALVVRRSGGYTLELDPECVDMCRHRRLVGEARDPACPDPQRVALLGQALDLWRGPALADLPGEWPARIRQGWQQQQLEAVLAWAHTCLRLGKPDVALARLTDLAGEHPMVESLAAALIRALCAAGRPADALDHYDRVRRLLADELGTDPGPELRQLHRQILTGDPAVGSSRTAAPPAPVPPSPAPVPRQLPALPQMFTGRARELAQLDGPPDTSTVVITAIDGMAGIGKTALAILAAHQIADRYPDGQLFIDLHGYTQGLDPIEPTQALDHMLRALGIPGEQIPPGLDERAALFRTRLADQRMLIVLDNAASEAQVRPLLPGGPGCLVLITSRRRLAGLDHTHTLSLDMLPPADAVALFTRSAGEDRLTTAPPRLLSEMVELCGRLPLAIRIAAARLRSHPSWDLARLVERLRDQRHRLGELEAGQRSITAALDLSYQHLNQDQRVAYRLLGLHPGPDIDPYATAALLDSTQLHAVRLLDQLLYAHLLSEPDPGRYRLHDLTRAHAAHCATGAEPEQTQRSALGRLLDHYRHTASVAMDATHPYERERRPQVPAARTPGPDLPDATAAAGWLDAELPNLLAAARYAAESGPPEQVWHLSTILHRHLRTRGRYRDAETLHYQALTTVRAAGNRAGEVDALLCLGHVDWRQGRHERAADHFTQALRIARATGHRRGELDALVGLGHVYRMQGRYELAAEHHQLALGTARRTGHRAAELDALVGLGHLHRMQGRYELAAEHHRQALEIARATGHRPGEQDALAGLGHLHRRQGRHEQAADHYQLALEIARATGHRAGELNALAGLGWVHRMRGRYQQAAGHYQQALGIARTTGHRAGEQVALAGLGWVHRMQGRYERAAHHYQQLLGLARETGDRNWQFEAWQGLGWLEYATGHPDAAIGGHHQALVLAGELGQPADQARAHDGLAHAHHALGRRDRARGHWRQALDILTGLSVDHTDDEETTATAIRARLTELDREAPPRDR